MQLVDLREDLKDVDLQDVYNMDESGLFWKASPDGTLATERTAGTKVQKARITANFCCNADGSHKLPPWFIGTAKNPRCFGRAGVNAENLAVVWKHNTKGWMTGRLFKEYLEWFDGLIYGRKVILLIDGFSAHKTGIDLHADEIHGGLRNTTIIFLPKNATALCQPLDQGIIKAWKSHYRRKWLQYMVDQMDLHENP